MAGLLIYGANGYTGALIAEKAVAAGLAPVLAGRNRAAVEALAKRLGCPWLAFDLKDRAALDKAVGDADVVLNCAGPFELTWEPVVRACLAKGAHYLDITGEIEVLEGCRALDAEAKAKGVMLLPACGFDVVPTDCLAGMLKERMPDATALTLVFGGNERPSRGTMKTATRKLGAATKVRRDGEVVDQTGGFKRQVDFGEGPVTVRATTWGDLVSAYASTGVADIEVFTQPSEAARQVARMPAWQKLLLATPLRGPILNSRINAMPPGPDEGERERGVSRFWGEARNGKGESVVLRMRTIEAYELTARTAVEIARRVLGGAAQPGYRTPAMAFGPGFILEFDGSAMVD